MPVILAKTSIVLLFRLILYNQAGSAVRALGAGQRTLRCFVGLAPILFLMVRSPDSDSVSYADFGYRYFIVVCPDC